MTEENKFTERRLDKVTTNFSKQLFPNKSELHRTIKQQQKKRNQRVLSTTQNMSQNKNV